jgi:hypothetical protein
MKRVAKPKTYLFVSAEKANKLVGVWHIARADKHTVCGRALPLAPSTFVGRSARARMTEPICKSCDRMKDAEPVRLA